MADQLNQDVRKILDDETNHTFGLVRKSALPEAEKNQALQALSDAIDAGNTTKQAELVFQIKDRLMQAELKAGAPRELGDFGAKPRPIKSAPDPGKPEPKRELGPMRFDTDPGYRDRSRAELSDALAKTSTLEPEKPEYAEAEKKELRDSLGRVSKAVDDKPEYMSPVEIQSMGGERFNLVGPPESAKNPPEPKTEAAPATKKVVESIKNKNFSNAFIGPPAPDADELATRNLRAKRDALAPSPLYDDLKKEADIFAKELGTLNEMYLRERDVLERREMYESLAQGLVLLAGAVVAYNQQVPLGDVKLHETDWASRRQALRAHMDQLIETNKLAYAAAKERIAAKVTDRETERAWINEQLQYIEARQALAYQKGLDKRKLDLEAERVAQGLMEIEIARDAAKIKLAEAKGKKAENRVEIINKQDQALRDVNLLLSGADELPPGANEETLRRSAANASTVYQSHMFDQVFLRDDTIERGLQDDTQKNAVRRAMQHKNMQVLNEIFTAYPDDVDKFNADPQGYLSRLDEKTKEPAFARFRLTQ